MARFTISSAKLRKCDQKQRFEQEYQGQWHEPPCYCKTSEGKNLKYRVDAEWRRAKVELDKIPWGRFQNLLFNSKMIARRFGECHACTIMARRQIAILAVLLSKLGIIEEKMFEDKK